MKTQTIVLAVLTACSIGVANAGNVTGLTTFTTGTKAVASEVNGNFGAVKTAVDDNNSRTTTNTADIATNIADIASLQAATGPEHVAYVSPSGGDYADPVAAMTDLATWCGTPSATNLCLVQIFPGVYDIGSGSVTMSAYVDVAGSGENVTRITGVNGGFSSGIFIGASNSRLSNLTVANTGGGTSHNGIYIPGVVDSTFVVEHVTVTSSGGSSSNRGVLAFGSATMRNVTITATGVSSNFALNSAGGTLSIVNSTIVATGGSTNNSGVLFNNAGLVIIRGSTVDASGAGARGLHSACNLNCGAATVQFSVIKGDTFAVDMETNFTLSASNSQLIGGVAAIGTRNCIYVSDGSFGALDATCQ